MKNLRCNLCDYAEDFQKKKEDFIGVFPPHTTLLNTNDNMCGLFVCPKCRNIMYVDDVEYLEHRKLLYKRRNR